ncbi:F-box domain-containing protein [Hirschfeldia incana]|nr:F-box domain-containing protein [Hirschfeldia incana]
MNTTTASSTMASLNSRPKRITKVEQPPQHKKKKNNSSSTRWFSLLPDEIVLNCLARISKSQYRSLSLVSKHIHSVLSSPELYTVRSQLGNTEPCLCIRQELPYHDRWYILDQSLVTTNNSNGLIKNEFNLLPITTSSLSKSTILAVGFEVYQMGGDQLPSSTVRVLDFRTRTWRDAPDMRVARKRPESALIDGKIYVVGGGTEESSWPEVFDLKSQTWNQLPSLNDDDDAEVQLHIGELLATTSNHNKYVFDSKQGTWKEQLGLMEQPGLMEQLGLMEQEQLALMESLGISYNRNGPWCVIENVKFSVLKGRLMWYKCGNWFGVKGLKHVCTKPHVNHHTTIQLANHGGGSILVLWDELHSHEFPVAGKMRKHVCKNRRIWCAVIQLEKRFSGLQFEVWGKIVRSNALLTVPKSFKLLSCITL